jgi:hypothetical protein
VVRKIVKAVDGLNGFSGCCADALHETPPHTTGQTTALRGAYVWTGSRDPPFRSQGICNYLGTHVLL